MSIYEKSGGRPRRLDRMPSRKRTKANAAMRAQMIGPHRCRHVFVIVGAQSVS
jgi:hypothetical protein